MSIILGPAMTEAVAAKLREPFTDEEVGKLPRIFCGACRQSQTKVCDKHKRVRCDGCKNNITDAHLHLDYVGHAEITDRLLQVDPQWTWEPLGHTSDGLPLFDANGGLWISLTVAGVTRLGYGDAEGKKGPSAIKETIGDALRNAAMRFGVALDLWGAQFDPPTSAAGDDSEGVGGAITGDQREVLADLWAQLGYGGDPQNNTRLAIAAKLLGLPALALFASLTHAQGGQLIGLLRDRLEAQTDKSTDEKKGV